MDREDQDLVSNKKKNKKAKKVNKKKKSVKKVPVMRYKVLSFLLIVLTVITFINLFVESIFSFFYLLPIAAFSFFIIFFISFILNKNKLKRWIKRIFSLFAILIIIFELLMILFGTNTLKFIASITDTGYRVETFGVYVLNDSSYNSLFDVNDKTFGYLDEGETIKEALKKISKQIDYERVSKSTTNDLVNSLINEETDAILMDISYEAILRDEQSEKYSRLRLIDKIDVVDIVDTIKSNVNITKDPFVVYISGIDTSGNIASKARSDVNILLAVNPNTKNVVMVNTPRDFYVTLHSKNKKDKLTHAGLFGVEESLMTLSDLYDVDIDYYVRINFTSFVKIVDELGGVKVNVPISFCEQNSKRSKKDGDLICLKQGSQTLNGEQALALARHRKTIPTGDRGRGENQMLVLEAIISKAMSPKIVTKYNSLVNALKGRVTTNMDSNQILSFARKQLKNNDVWNFTSLSATGSDSSGVCYATGSGKAYVMEPDKESVSRIKSALNQLFDGEQEILVN
ncbi:MAG: LCP family protein [Erysipelotrichales bacterium]|nr:LCP family protein [Erysipelotrichales bacterium]